MATPRGVLNKTLQSLTLTKIRELEKQRNSFESRKTTFLAKAEASTSPRDRLTCLLEGIRELYPAAATDDSLENIQRWLDQSAYDTTIPSSMLEDFDHQLKTKLDVQSRKLDIAHLYSRLLTEWMASDSSASDDGLASSPEDDSGGEESFEVVAERQKQRLAELVDKFESVVFTPLETSEEQIVEFLDGLFPDDFAEARLEALREKIKDQGKKLMEEESPFDRESLVRCIRGLLTEDLLSDEKQAILRDFMDNDAALNEIADVLNMRYVDLKNWEWNAGPDGIPVYPRQQLNGKYRIWADEDILQLIFVQYIGIRLCNLLKSSLKTFITEKGVYNFQQTAPVTPRDNDRRQFFLGSNIAPFVSIEKKRQDAYLESFFLSQLPEGETSLFDRGGCGYDDDSDVTESEDNNNWISLNKVSKDPPKPQGSIKQRLLRQLTVELLVQQTRGRVHNGGQPGSVAITQTDLQWYATGLPHSTVFAAMRYVGFSEDWISFFKKYLEAPLNLDSSVTGGRASRGPRIRKRGVPMAHSSEKFTGELVLFFLDLTVNRETGLLLYRLHDDIWLCGDPQKCAKAWTSMQRFGKVFGLEFNRNKTGSVYLCPPGATRDKSVDEVLPEGPVTMGFLKLDPATGSWQIDQPQVDAHVKQLQKQLDGCDSVLAWVRTWNSCIGRFFSYTFGEPSECHGRKHIDSILDTYRRMQQELFGEGGNVVERLKGMIRDRFQAAVPDAFLFLPEQLGGLGLRNPFVNLFLVRDNVAAEPEEIVQKFLKDEHDLYVESKKRFEADDESVLRRRAAYLKVKPDDPLPRGFSSEEEMKCFMPLEEFSRVRETHSSQFLKVYERLMALPDKKDVKLSKEVRFELDRLVDDQLDGRRPDPEKMWILQLYSRELFEVCGGLSLVDKKFLPVGVFNMMKGKKVTWQMVL